jgi:hypothetical protein
MSDVEQQIENAALPLEEATEKYWPAFRQNVHTLLAWGYADSLQRVQTNNQQEPDITGFIAEAIKKRRNDINCPDWCERIVVEDDPPIPGGGRTGRSRWRPDLIFTLIGSGKKPLPEYYFEAKRLRKPYKTSVNEYIGEDGLGCFLSGKYAPKCVEAGMLGYVQSDNVNSWITKLHMALEHSRLHMNELLVLSPPCAVHIIDAFSDEWVSQHNRSVGTPVTIHHILLDYRVP